MQTTNKCLDLRWIDFLNEDQCAEIITRYNNLAMLDNLEEEKRKCKIFPFNPAEVDKLPQALYEANNIFYEFDLSKNIECYFGRYDENDHFNTWHIDSNIVSEQRKLSFSILLNNDFTGGEFETMEYGKLEKKKGRLLVFPSFYPHKVNPVTNKTRYAIFGFVLGPAWR